MSELPKLDSQGAVTINTLMLLFEKQLWTFAEFLNDSPQKCVPTWKYVDYILYALKKEFDRQFTDSKWKYPDQEQQDVV
jgi:hypothetical protein